MSLQNAEFHNLLITKYSGDSITNNKLDGASVMVMVMVMVMGQKTAYVILLRKCEGKRQLERPRHG